MFTRMWLALCIHTFILYLSDCKCRATNMIICTHNPDISFLVHTFRAPLYLLAQHLEMTMERNMFILDCMRKSIGTIGTIGIAGKIWWISFISHAHGWLSMILFALFAPCILRQPLWRLQRVQKRPNLLQAKDFWGVNEGYHIWNCWDPNLRC